MLGVSMLSAECSGGSLKEQEAHAGCPVEIGRVCTMPASDRHERLSKVAPGLARVCIASWRRVNPGGGAKANRFSKIAI